MTVYFCDSSALVKCYVQERGSAWMRTLLDPTAGHHLYLASITGVEVIAAVTRRLRRGDMAATDGAARNRGAVPPRFRAALPPHRPHPIPGSQGHGLSRDSWLARL